MASQREQWRLRSAQSELQWQALLQHCPVGIAITRRGRLEIVGQQSGQMLGYAVDDLQGQSVAMLYPSQADFLQLQERVRDAFIAHGAFEGDLCLLRKDASSLWVRVQGRPLGQGGQRVGTLWLLEDLTAERAALRAQDWASMHDALTLLPNRTALEMRLEPLLVQARQGACEMGQVAHVAAPAGVLMFLDLDHFSAINDEAGHEAGNDVLRRIARLIEAQVRQMGWTAHIGGDVFAVVLPGAGLEHGQAVAAQLRAAVRDCNPAYQGRSYFLTASVGLVLLHGHGMDAAQALQAADMACYAAKRARQQRPMVH